MWGGRAWTYAESMGTLAINQASTATGRHVTADGREG
jgi:hypothetical protein